MAMPAARHTSSSTSKGNHHTPSTTSKVHHSKTTGGPHLPTSTSSIDEDGNNEELHTLVKPKITYLPKIKKGDTKAEKKEELTEKILDFFKCTAGTSL